MLITTKYFITFGFLPPPNSQPSHSSESRKSISLCSSSSLAALKNRDRTLLWDNSMRLEKCYRSKGFLVRSAVQPGAPPPSGPPFNFINWIVGIAITVVLPFFSNKWTSLLRIKNGVETAVEIADEIVVAVEKVAEGVEKAAENIAEDLPEGGGLRKVVDFVEHVAERANKDAHIVGDFIDKVQEVEEKVENYVESLVEGGVITGHKEDHQENEAQLKEEEDRAHDSPKPKEEEDISNDGTHKQ